MRGKRVMRYVDAGDLGRPESACLICRFWLIDVWWKLDRREEGHRHVQRRAAISQPLRAAGGGRSSAKRRAVRKLSPDLLDGRADLDRDAFVAKLGRSTLARLVVVSNRVSVPIRRRRKARRRTRSGVAAGATAATAAFGSAGAARSPHRTSVETRSDQAQERRICRHRSLERATIRNTTTALPIACYGRSCITGSISRSSRAVISAAIPGQRSLRDRVGKGHRRGRSDLGPRLPYDPDRGRVAAARPRQPHRILPAHPASAAGDPDLAAQKRATHSVCCWRTMSWVFRPRAIVGNFVRYVLTECRTTAGNAGIRDRQPSDHFEDEWA